MAVGEGRRPSTGAATAAGLVVAVGLLAGFFLVMNTVETEIWQGLGVAAGLSLVTLPLLALVLRREEDPWIRVIITLGIVGKIAGSIARYYVAFVVYEGSADALRYVRAGEEYAAHFLGGDLSPIGDGRFVGTPVLEYLTGIVVTLTGPSLLGAFLVFSWLSFWGLYGFYRAFRIAVPDGDARRYALLVFLLPSLLFWPSSLGKEAWILACLGLAAYGAARMLTRSGGYAAALAGGFGVAIIRPHIALLLFAALAAGYLRRTRGERAPLFGPVPQAVGVVALLAVMFVGLQQVEEFFGVEEETDGVADTAEQILDFTTDRTATGGSEFDAAPIENPLQFPEAFVTVLFRPWPTEADNAQMLLTALESLVLLGFVALSWRRIRAAMRQAWSNPYIRMALVYTIGFIIAYAAIANFGILARQRAQLYPFFLVLLSVRPWVRARRGEDGVVADDAAEVAPGPAPRLDRLDRLE